ncbi:MAG: tetratricopeptide repeat protein [Brasilonema angustatum HA4187-MV1]|jgi:CHAT domain-containing protein/Flp pilus assembly protein TadD|nr:tetratricopeptide repeat protein [Brasilonema angustatum HA4187-MV1]
MQLKSISLATLIALLASSTAPFISTKVLFASMRVLAQSTNSLKEEADKLIEQGNQQLNTSQFQAALRSYQQALKIYQSIKDKRGEGMSLNNLGIAYKSLGDYKQAIQYYQQSLEIDRAIGDKQGEGASLGNLGIAYDSLGDYKQAIHYQQQSLSIDRAIGDKQGEGKSLGNLGLAYLSLGDYKQAIHYQQQSLKISRAISDKQSEGKSLGNLGLAYRSLGDYKQAIHYQQQSLSIALALGDKQGEGNSLGNLGNAYYSLGEYKQAIHYQQQSLSIALALGDKQSERASLGNLGLAYRSLGEYKQAIQYQQQSLSIARAIGDKQGEGNSLGNLGSAYHSLGEYKQAIHYQQQSLSIALALGDKLGEGASLNNLGLALLNSNNPKAAETNLHKAITVWESIRTSLGDNDTFKVSIFETQAVTYRLLQQALIAQNQPTQALLIAERGRAQAFAELLAARQQSNSSAPPNIERIQQIAKQQNATVVEYSIASDDLYIWVIKPTGKITFHKVDIKNTNLVNFAEDTRTAAATLAEGRGVANNVINGLVRQTRSTLKTTTDNVSSPETTADTTQTVRPLGCRGNSCLKQMYKLLIQPIAAELPTNPDSRVIFIPHESLFLVPFAALQDENEKFLIEKHTILIAPSVQVLELTHQKRLKLQQAAQKNSALIVGNPTMPKVAPKIGESAEQLKSLPYAETEAKNIAELFKTQPLVGKQATKAAVQQQMVKARIIHLATHGLLDNIDEPGIPGVVALAPDGNDDGLLTANDVLKLKLNAELVVLSACDTGWGRITGDGVIGLPRAFITAGTPSIVASLWQVPDESTAFLMPEFYRQLRNNRDKARALRQAMLETRKKYPNPSDWAAFIFIGEAE